LKEAFGGSKKSKDFEAFLKKRGYSASERQSDESQTVNPKSKAIAMRTPVEYRANARDKAAKKD